MLCIDPLICHIEKKVTIQDSSANIIAKMQPFTFMDDITMITKLMRYHQCTDYNNHQLMLMPNNVQQSIVNLMQRVIDTRAWHLSLNNIPQNEGKTKMMTIHELGYKSTKRPPTSQNNAKLSQWCQLQMSSQSNDPNYILRNTNFVILNTAQEKETMVKML